MRVNLQAAIYSKTIQLICICFWKGVDKELYGTGQLLSILMIEFTHVCKLSISSDKLFIHYTPEKYCWIRATSREIMLLPYGEN